MALESIQSNRPRWLSLFMDLLQTCNFDFVIFSALLQHFKDEGNSIIIALMIIILYEIFYSIRLLNWCCCCCSWYIGYPGDRAREAIVSALQFTEPDVINYIVNGSNFCKMVVCLYNNLSTYPPISTIQSIYLSQEIYPILFSSLLFCFVLIYSLLYSLIVFDLMIRAFCRWMICYHFILLYRFWARTITQFNRKYSPNSKPNWNSVVQ